MSKIQSSGTGSLLKSPLVFVNPLKGYLDTERLEPELKDRLKVIDLDKLQSLEQVDTIIAHSFSCIPVALACLKKEIKPRVLLWLEPENLLYNKSLVEETLLESNQALIKRLRSSIDSLSIEPLFKARWLDCLESNPENFRQTLELHHEALGRPYFAAEIASMPSKLVVGLSDYYQLREWNEKRFHEYGLANFTSIHWMTLRNCGFFAFEEQGGIPLLGALAQLALWTGP